VATEAYIDGNKINDERPLAVQAQGGTDAIGGVQVGEQPPDEMKEFLLVLRRALILIVHWINRKYDLP
jgi:hypothetical protein